MKEINDAVLDEVTGGVLSSEASAWYTRNRDALYAQDSEQKLPRIEYEVSSCPNTIGINEFKGYLTEKGFDVSGMI